MATKLLDNPYRGINAHLHSIAQNPRGTSATIWTSLHASHISHIIDTLNAELPMSYVARAEQSLQIWTEDLDDDLPRSRKPRPDVAIFGGGVPSDSPQKVKPEETPVREIEIQPEKEREITIPAAVIYELQDHEVAGKPVTRIELLSESNKIGGSGLHGYRDNRVTAMLSGTSLVELGYLHQSGSPLPKIPRYPLEPGSHAYSIALTDRRPGHRSVMLVYEIDVDMALPSAISIPLAEGESIDFDFEAVYQHTFRTGRWGTHIDYDELPRSVEKYSEADRKRIEQVMARAKAAVAEGE